MSLDGRSDAEDFIQTWPDFQCDTRFSIHINNCWIPCRSGAVGDALRSKKNRVKEIFTLGLTMSQVSPAWNKKEISKPEASHVRLNSSN